jgi:hypothetical protein
VHANQSFQKWTQSHSSMLNEGTKVPFRTLLKRLYLGMSFRADANRSKYKDVVSCRMS